jgi:hypothetical protein
MISTSTRDDNALNRLGIALCSPKYAKEIIDAINAGGVDDDSMFALATHLHTGVYSPVAHLHTGVYQPVLTTVAAIGLDAELDADKITAIISALRTNGILGPNA